MVGGQAIGWDGKQQKPWLGHCWSSHDTISEIQSQNMYFSKNFCGACPQTPLEGSCFAFWTMLCIMQMNPIQLFFVPSI